MKENEHDIIFRNKHKILEIQYCLGMGCPLPDEFKDWNPDQRTLNLLAKEARRYIQDYIPPELEINMDDIQSPSDLVYVSARIINAVTAGKISYTLGQKLQNMIERQVGMEEKVSVTELIEELQTEHKRVMDQKNSISNEQYAQPKQITRQESEAEEAEETVDVDAEEIEPIDYPPLTPIPGGRKYV